MSTSFSSQLYYISNLELLIFDCGSSNVRELKKNKIIVSIIDHHMKNNFIASCYFAYRTFSGPLAVSYDKQFSFPPFAKFKFSSQIITAIIVLNKIELFSKSVLIII